MILGFFVALCATPQQKVEVQGHRGARAVRPENTMEAFRYAADVGVDVLELDLGVTKDDQLVVAHDPWVTPKLCKTPRKIAIRSLTFKEVSKHKCPKVAMPRFIDVVQLAKKRKLRLNAETKIVPGAPELTPEPTRFAALVVAVLKDLDMVEQTTLQSFDRRTLIAAKKLAPGLSIAQLTGENFVDMVAVARGSGADIISPNQHWITNEEVERLHAAKVRVIPWTVNAEQDWARLLQMGVDGLITDDPEKLIAYLKKRNLR